ncbi:MAG: DNA-directed RNA polymerase subunit alpha C-terminal domain-containing protein [Bacteroidales bacterium]|jgi:hypothetical protein
MEHKDEDRITRNHLRELYKVFFDADTLKLFELPERDLLILQLRWLDGKTFKEIGKEIGLSAQGISYTYAKILKRLNKKMYRLSIISKRQKEVMEQNLKLKKEVSLLTKRIKKINLAELKIYAPSLYGEITNPVYNSEVRDMALSARTMHCLLQGDINTIGEIMEHKRKELLRYRGLGKKSLAELENYLKEHYSLELKK